MSEGPSTTDIPLDDIDKLLQSEDPEFAKGLEEVRNVESDPTVSIDASAIDEGLAADDAQVASETGKSTWRLKFARFKQRVRERLALGLTNALIFVKTRPKEFFFYALVLLKALLQAALTPLALFRNANKAQKAVLVLLLALSGVAVWVLMQNLRGTWLPQLNEPLLHSFEPYADSVVKFDTHEDGESFFSAFPQERHEFLFPKMKVNLKRTAENPLPMGAFEIIAVADSKEAAIELHDREVELSDSIQRLLEDETFADLETENGKGALKARIKNELNPKMAQGWITDIDFKTFILKP